jgi:hypothetical protein
MFAAVRSATPPTLQVGTQRYREGEKEAACPSDPDEKDGRTQVCCNNPQ